jgi:hypothetical protein
MPLIRFFYAADFVNRWIMRRRWFFMRMRIGAMSRFLKVVIAASKPLILNGDTGFLIGIINCVRCYCIKLSFS